MISIVVPQTRLFNELTNEIITIKETTLQLEHSLISLKKWEQKWHMPFLKSNENLTNEQIIDYIRCMTINSNVDPNLYLALTPQNKIDVVNYIQDPMTATWFREDAQGSKSFNKETVTNEIIYYWMIELGIPVEFQKWHLNSLMTLIKVVNIKRNPKKMNNKDAAAYRKQVSARNKARMAAKKGGK